MNDPMAGIRFTVVVSHPIQYYAPFYRALAAQSGMDVHVIYASRIGLDRTLDKGMGVELAWKMDLLGGYGHEFLPEASTITSTDFRTMDAPSIVKALHRRQPTVVLLHGFSNKLTLRALAWCRRHKVPTLMISDSSLHAGTPLWARAAKRAVLPMLLAQYGAFLAIGDSNQAYLESFGVLPRRIFRVPNMVDEGFWQRREQRAAAREAWRARLDLAPDELALLFVGKLKPRKRPGDVLAALERVRSSGGAQRPIRALFAGNGEQMELLTERARTQDLPATFLGFVNVDELPSLYCAADALVHPAEIETFGVIVLEAAILGLPLVLSERVGALGPTSVARSGQNALVHACGDVEGLATAIRRLANEPQTLAALADASIAVSRDHDGRKSVAGTVAAVRHCLGLAPAPDQLDLAA
jgi:glycosyltransferase involved in cell wall biosynthesis